jgi:hypothetical protein
MMEEERLVEFPKLTFQVFFVPPSLIRPLLIDLLGFKMGIFEEEPQNLTQVM